MRCAVAALSAMRVPCAGGTNGASPFGIPGGAVPLHPKCESFLVTSYGGACPTPRRPDAPTPRRPDAPTPRRRVTISVVAAGVSPWSMRHGTSALLPNTNWGAGATRRVLGGVYRRATRGQRHRHLFPRRPPRLGQRRHRREQHANRWRQAGIRRLGQRVQRRHHPAHGLHPFATYHHCLPRLHRPHCPHPMLTVQARRRGGFETRPDAA